MRFKLSMVIREPKKGACVAKEAHFCSQVFNPTWMEKVQTLLKRWNITESTPVLGSGSTSVALATHTTRVVKITDCEEEARVAYHLAKLGKKIPHVVRVFDVKRVMFPNGYEKYFIRTERLHTRVVDVPAVGSRWDALKVNEKACNYVIKKALRDAKLLKPGSDVWDFGEHNVMFDYLNRPTWFDFSHDFNSCFIGANELPPVWDEAAERKKLAQRFQRKIKKAA